MSDAVARLAAVLLESAKQHGQDLWDELSSDALRAVEDAAWDYANLTARALQGEDVAEELVIVRATLSNWNFVGASAAARALQKAAQDMAITLGKMLVGLAAGLV